MRDRSQSASLDACITATYSLSVVDSETISCRLAAQEISVAGVRLKTGLEAETGHMTNQAWPHLYVTKPQPT
jgi:hypothetical protein